MPERFFAALLLVACDVPAARKLCDFLGHGARRGCSKCKKEFIPGEHFFPKTNFIYKTKATQLTILTTLLTNLQYFTYNTNSNITYNITAVLTNYNITQYYRNKRKK